MLKNHPCRRMERAQGHDKLGQIYLKQFKFKEAEECFTISMNLKEELYGFKMIFVA